MARPKIDLFALAIFASHLLMCFGGNARLFHKTT